MTIFITPAWYPNPEKSIHHGIFIKRHAEAIALTNKVVVIYAYSSNEEKIIVTENDNFNEVIICYKKKANKFLSFIFQYSQHKIALQNAFDIAFKTFGKPSIIHQHIAFPHGLFTYKLSKKYNIPYIISEQWTGYVPLDNAYNNFFIKYFTKKIFKQSKTTTAVSKTLSNAIENHNLANKVFVIPNVVDISKFNYIPNRTTNNITRILHVSTIDDKQKNIKMLLKAMKLIENEGYDFILDIVGDSDDREMLEKFSKKLNFASEINFYGSKSPDELISFYQQSDFFVLSSNYETFCVVLIEALACGLPIVATNDRAVCEIVNDKNGLLSEINNTENFAAQIMLMLETYHKYNASELRASVETRFSKETISRKFDEVYRKIS